MNLGAMKLKKHHHPFITTTKHRSKQSNYVKKTTVDRIGGTQVTDVDNSGALISDPRTATGDHILILSYK
jgi:hypothetical protein